MTLGLDEVRGRVARLDLPAGDHVAFGSVPLLAHGLIDRVSDVDILARGVAWSKATTLGHVRVAAAGDQVIDAGDDIEIFDGWRDLDIDEIVDSGTVVSGIRVADLRHVLDFKRRLGRPKDREHIAIIERWLDEHSDPTPDR